MRPCRSCARASPPPVALCYLAPMPRTGYSPSHSIRPLTLRSCPSSPSIHQASIGSIRSSNDQAVNPHPHSPTSHSLTSIPLIVVSYSRSYRALSPQCGIRSQSRFVRVSLPFGDACEQREWRVLALDNGLSLSPTHALTLDQSTQSTHSFSQRTQSNVTAGYHYHQHDHHYHVWLSLEQHSIHQ